MSMHDSLASICGERAPGNIYLSLMVIETDVDKMSRLRTECDERCRWNISLRRGSVSPRNPRDIQESHEYEVERSSCDHNEASRMQNVVNTLLQHSASDR